MRLGRGAPRPVALDAPSQAAAKGASLVFAPTFTSSSSGSALLTWPPDGFAIEMTCAVTDAEGRSVWSGTLKGEGSATGKEALKIFSIAGDRAAFDLLKKFGA